MRSFFSVVFSEGIFRPLFFVPCDRDDFRLLASQMRDRKFRKELVLAAGCRCAHGFPRVILCDPLSDSRPFPTLFWLWLPMLRKKCATLETAGGVREMESALVGKESEWMRYHRVYSAIRSLLIPERTRTFLSARRRTQWRSFRLGGVGGTMPLGSSGRTGVKCLHLHTASWLALGRHPAREWLAEKIGGNACDDPHSFGCVPAPQSSIVT